MVKRKVFNPWEISGDIDYDKLVKEFGVSSLNDLPNFMINKLKMAPEEVKNMMVTAETKPLPENHCLSPADFETPFNLSVILL